MSESTNPPKFTDTPTLTSLKTAVKQEIAHLSLVHPTPKDIPTCWELFNTTLSCYSLGNQTKSLYRYGSMAQCSQKSNDWKYCVTIGRLDPEEKRKKWLEYRARWWAERRVEGSCEDVWDFRSEPIKRYPGPPVPFMLDEKTREFVPIHPEVPTNAPSQTRWPELTDPALPSYPKSSIHTP